MINRSGSQWYAQFMTSTQVEYEALKFGLRESRAAVGKHLTVKGDCKGVIDQMNVRGESFYELFDGMLVGSYTSP